MDISEEVLFNTLAQIDKKTFQEANKNFKKEQKAFDVIKQKEQPKRKIDVQYELERKIIEILLLYGNTEEEFEDLVLKESETTGDLELEPVVQKAKVFEKIYLDLQEDEMQFTNPMFKTLYYSLINTLHTDGEFSTKAFVNGLEQDLAGEVTSILMDDEKYHLHDWESKNIVAKEKMHTIAQLVNQTILSLRCHLIDKKVLEYQLESQNNTNNHSILEDVKDYLGLKMLLSRKLGKVIGG